MRCPPVASDMPSRWTPTLGAVHTVAGTTFRVWAPRPHDVALVLREHGKERIHPLEDAGEGYRETTLSRVSAGARYGYLLDGRGPLPDPASRRQPEGVHGMSALIDPAAFRWTDDSWSPPPFRDLVIYECHVGTLTPGGTFDSAIDALAGIRSLGITAVELMPVASFPGRWNWGYDGASLFAPAEVYGGPDGLRRFVNAAHEVGLAVILDVVYNHFGPDGNYTGLYSGDYVTTRYATPWGPAINFDGRGSIHIRRFFRENLLHWLHEYHIDGFRFDATHAIFDGSPKHILAELAEAVDGAKRLPVRPYLIAESHENDVRYVRPLAEGGHGFDAVWADDFHHAVRAALLDEHDGYLRGFDGSVRELAQTLRQGFLYEGQFDPGCDHARGTRARRCAWGSFVYCIQNHDQVGNRAFGQRLNVSASHVDFLAATLLLLLLPQTPLLFQGQEHLSSRPFLYFSDHVDDLGRAVAEGRRREFAAFRAFADSISQRAIPDPQAEATFRSSVIDREEGAQGPGILCANLVGSALALRHGDAVFCEYRERRLPIRTAVRGRCLLLAFHGQKGRRWVAVNFGERTTMPMPANVTATVAIHSNESRFGGNGVAPVCEPGRLTVPGHSAVVLCE